MNNRSKIILYTQRVEIVAGYGERRDCADQQIARFLRTCNFMPVPVNNLPESIEEFVDCLRPAGILLTGGNHLTGYGGNAPERDETERTLLDYALRKDIPLLGFCRGMQIIADYFGNPLQQVEGHVACRHPIEGEMAHSLVNSYHNWGLLSVSEPLRVLARSQDGVIEAVRHSEKRLMGIMWHPEREVPFREEDIELFSAFYCPV